MENSDRYCFVIDACGYPSCDYKRGGIETLEDNNFKVFFAYSDNNPNLQKYLMLSTNSICSEIFIDRSTNPVRYNFGDFVVEQIFNTSEKQHIILTSSGLKKLPKDFGKISTTSISDYDHDGLTDIAEINTGLVTFEANGAISYPSFDIIKEKTCGELFYVERGLERLEADMDKTFHNFMRSITIMPIKSDPTDKDGDKDKVVDGVDLRPLKYIPNFENVDLDSEEIICYYNMRMDMLPCYDEYGYPITGENRKNIKTKYYFDEYILTRYPYLEYNQWTEEIYGLSEKEIYFQNSYDQIIEGNGYDGDVTLLGTVGSIIVGFTPFGIICDIRDITIDVVQFDKDKGFKQGKDWYLQAIPDFIGILPLAGDIYRGAGDSLSLLSKTDATKIVNEAIESATDSTGKIIKSSDEIVKTISDEAEAIVKEIDYKKTDEIVDVIGDTASEASAKIAKKAVDTSELIGESGKFIDDTLEAKYLDYVNGKIKNGGKIKGRLDWKKAVDNFKNNRKIFKGIKFNRKAWAESPELYHEIHLANGKILDTYDPKNGLIISRKATDLSDIKKSTFESYLREMINKYKPGTRIRSDKYKYFLEEFNLEPIDGDVLKGKMCLEIPSSNKDFEYIDEYIELAKSKYNITIIFRDE